MSKRDLAVAMGRSEKALHGVLGALGRRVNGTSGVDQIKLPGSGLLLTVRDDNGEWYYTLRPEAREVLEMGGYV